MIVGFFTLPNNIEVINYLIWRQQDTVRNSISSLAQYLFSPKELHGKDTTQMKEMSLKKGVNWDDYDPKLKRGRLITKEKYDKDGTVRTRWVSNGSPTFKTDDKSILKLIPLNV